MKPKSLFVGAVAVRVVAHPQRNGDNGNHKQDRHYPVEPVRVVGEHFTRHILQRGTGVE